MSRFVFPVFFAAWTLVVGPLAAAEPWADPDLPIVQQLELWLDASRQDEARKKANRPVLAANAPLDVWFDASGSQRHLRQDFAPARPKRTRVANAEVVQFDGVDDHLRCLGKDSALESFTIFLVAVPRGNPGAFRAFLAFNAPNQRDWTSGLTIDQSGWAGPAFSQLNVEGRGFQGAQNLLKQTSPFGTAHIIEARADSSAGKLNLIVDGKPGGERKIEWAPISLQEITVGARYYTNEAAPQEVRGFIEADIAEVLVYGRALTESELLKVRSYLDAKYADLKRVSETPVGTPLVTVKSPPAVQVLVPGFAARQLPLELPNINNVRCRPDGKLLALAYDGDLYLLSDTDGDGLEDRAVRFWENKGRLRAPIGMALTPPGYARGNGAFVAAKGKCSLIVDTDGDDRADREIIVAEGWKEISHGVDALGVAIDPTDDSVYFGIGTANFTNPYVIDDHSRAQYQTTGERAAILRVSPDFQSREVFCSGIRFPVAMAFRSDGELFATDQEGATWLANGNPFDELLHIQRSRHYGFPPRHPDRLPNVIDEPSVYDYGPQHQSTCGLSFNEPVTLNDVVFGPKSWRSDALVAGYSRGKLYRTSLVRQPAGYAAQNHLLACLNQLTVDACVGRDGSLTIATHSGGPDWGSGPSGAGKLYKLTYSDPELPQPVCVWPAAPGEVRVAFDRPLDPARLRGLAGKATIQYGEAVRAGDRFETLHPGYAAVSAQLAAPRYEESVQSVQLSSDQRTLILLTEPRTTAVPHAITLPTSVVGDSKQPPDELIEQHPQIDLDFDLTGVNAQWTAKDGLTTWTGWLPHLDLQVVQAFTTGSSPHSEFWPLLSQAGQLVLHTQLDLRDMLRPAVQPGSQLDYTWPAETVTLTIRGTEPLTLKSAVGAVERVDDNAVKLVVSSPLKEPVAIELMLTTSNVAPQLNVTWTTAEDSRPRTLPLRRMIVPWAKLNATANALLTAKRPVELEGGSWSRGRQVFFHKEVGCAKCHTIHGKGSLAAPNLSNLVHRDYASVLRDISDPSFAINPDFATYIIEEASGKVHTGTIRTVGTTLHVTDTNGKLTVLERDQVETILPAKLSTMPKDLPKLLGPQRMTDLLTFLLTPPPRMPRDAPTPPPAPRRRAEVETVLGGAPEATQSPRTLKITLVSGLKDHGPGEHDYPAWQTAWTELLGAMDQTAVSTAWEWPSAEDLTSSDVLVFYQHGTWTSDRARDIDAFLARGGGLVYIHYAVDGGQNAPDFAQRIGLAWKGGHSRFRHGPLELKFDSESSHPIARNFHTVKFVDESYWQLLGNLPPEKVLARGEEDGQPQPLFWALESGKGRVFVSIPGHFSWTFDDPLFRVLLLRGIAWTAGEPVDRFNEAVWPGAAVQE